jgi:hypothetical protein
VILDRLLLYQLEFRSILSLSIGFLSYVINVRSSCYAFRKIIEKHQLISLSAAHFDEETLMWSTFTKLDLFLYFGNLRFQVLTAASMMFRAVFWVILPCKMIVDRRFRGAYCLHHQG